MKNLLPLLFCFIIVHNFSAQNQSDRWIEVATTKQNDIYYISTDITNENKTQATFWTKWIYGKDKPKVNEHLVKERVDLVTFDFENKEFKFEKSYYYNFKGIEVKQNEHYSEFQTIVPETTIEAAYEEAKFIKYQKIEMLKAKEDSLLFVINLADSLYNSKALSKSIAFYQYSKNLINWLMSSYEESTEFDSKKEDQLFKIKKIENDVNVKIKQLNIQLEKQKEYLEWIEKANQNLQKDTLKSIEFYERANAINYSQEIESQISQLKEKMLTNEINNLIANSKNALKSDTLLAIDFLERANTLRYSRDISNQIKILNEELTTSKVKRLLTLANNSMKTDTLLAIENLELALQLKPNNDLVQKIEDLKETYRINRLRSYLINEKTKFIKEKNLLLQWDSLIRLEILRKHKNIKTAYDIYFETFLKNAVSYNFVDNYFKTGVNNREVNLGNINPFLAVYQSEISTLFEVQNYFKTQTQDNLKALNKALKNIETFEEIKAKFQVLK